MILKKFFFSDYTTFRALCSVHRFLMVEIVPGFASRCIGSGWWISFQALWPGASLPDGGDRSGRCVQVHWFRMVDIVPGVANLQRFRMLEIVPGVVAWCIASSWWRSFRALRSVHRFRVMKIVPGVVSWCIAS